MQLEGADRKFGEIRMKRFSMKELRNSRIGNCEIWINRDKADRGESYLIGRDLLSLTRKFSMRSDRGFTRRAASSRRRVRRCREKGRKDKSRKKKGKSSSDSTHTRAWRAESPRERSRFRSIETSSLRTRPDVSRRYVGRRRRRRV